MPYARRQFAMTVVDGDQDTLIDASGDVPLYQSVDVNPRMVLKLADGGYAGYMTSIASAATHTVQLPNSYTSASRLFFTMKSSVTAKVVVTSPDHSTSTVLVSVVGTDPGVFSFCGTVTAITVNIPGAAASDVEFLCWTMPDITLAEGWRQGEQSTGVQD